MPSPALPLLPDAVAYGNIAFSTQTNKVKSMSRLDEIIYRECKSQATRVVLSPEEKERLLRFCQGHKAQSAVIRAALAEFLDRNEPRKERPAEGDE